MLTQLIPVQIQIRISPRLQTRFSYAAKTISTFYMPAANTRAMDKARDLYCDGIIFDLEDAVAVASKEQARGNVVAQISAGGYGRRSSLCGSMA